jgi:hypothetical protein
MGFARPRNTYHWFFESRGRPLPSIPFRGRLVRVRTRPGPSRWAPQTEAADAPGAGEIARKGLAEEGSAAGRAVGHVPPGEHEQSLSPGGRRVFGGWGWSEGGPRLGERFGGGIEPGVADLLCPAGWCA